MFDKKLEKNISLVSWVVLFLAMLVIDAISAIYLFGQNAWSLLSLAGTIFSNVMLLWFFLINKREY